MFCPNCGTALRDGARFCPSCGSEQVPAAQTTGQVQQQPRYARQQGQSSVQPRNTQQPGTMISPNICLCPDGAYRWVYEYNLMRHPRVMIMLFKIFFFIFLGLFGMLALIDVFNGGDDLGEKLLSTLKIFGIMVGIFTVLTVISYYIYAAINSGKYIVLFEMTDTYVRHTQARAQFKKLQAIGMFTFLMGVAQHSLAEMAIGLNVATNNEMLSEFNKVKNVKLRRHSHTIDVNKTLFKNQVYADEVDFDFVANYIIQRCPQAKIKYLR